MMNEKEIIQYLKEGGREVTIPYLKINNGTNKTIGDFGQDIEPTGNYITYNDHRFKIESDTFYYGFISFKNPLIVDFINTTSTGWKRVVSELFNNKKGRTLSKAIIKAGYDCIITIDGDNISEIVDLTNFK